MHLVWFPKPFVHYNQLHKFIIPCSTTENRSHFGYIEPYNPLRASLVWCQLEALVKVMFGNT